MTNFRLSPARFHAWPRAAFKTMAAFAVGVALAVVPLTMPAHAQITADALAGHWTGGYRCNGQDVLATLTMQKSSEARLTGVFAFSEVAKGTAAPVKGSYRFGVRIREGDRIVINPHEWIERPQDYVYVQLNGTVRSGQLKLDTGLAECSELTFDLQAPGVVAADPSPGTRTGLPVPATAGRPVAPAPRGPTPPITADADQNGRKLKPELLAALQETRDATIGLWEGKATCLTGPLNVELRVFPDAKGDGLSAAVVLAGASRLLGAPSRDFAGTVRMNANMRRPEFESDPQAQVTGAKVDALKMRLYPVGDRMTGQLVDTLSCSMNLKRVSTDAGTPVSRSVPVTPFMSLLGDWDGVVLTKNSAEHVSISIGQAETPSSTVVFAATASFRGKTDRLALATFDSKTLQFEKLQATDRSLFAGKVPREIGATPYGDALLLHVAGGTGLLFRRPTDQKDPLDRVCQTHIGTALDAGVAAYNATRRLKEAFYPAFAGFEETSAAARAALAAPSVRAMGADRFVALAELCLLTSTEFDTIVWSKAFDNVVDIAAIGKIRGSVARAGTPKFPGRLGKPGVEPRIAGILSQTEAASVHLAQAGTIGQADIPEAMITQLSALAPQLAHVQAEALWATLQPAAQRLDIFEKAAIASRAEARVARARQRMAGVVTPGWLAGQSARFEALTSGRMAALDGDSMSVFGGFAHAALDKCAAQFDPGTKARIIGSVLKGASRSMGTEYATGGLGQTMQSQMQNAGLYALGAEIAKDMPCDMPYLKKVLETLGDLATRDTVNGWNRASLFARSCALDRPSSQCACVETSLDNVMPDLGQQRYSPNLISMLIRKNPLVAGPMLAACGVQRY